MKNDFDSAILETGKLIQRGKLALMENLGKTVALITVAITLLVTFTDVGFGRFSVESFASSTGLLLISSYLMYFSLGEAGQRLGRQSEEYLSLRADHSRLRDSVSGEMMKELRKFCLDYTKDELSFRRLRALADAGIEEEADPSSLTPSERRRKRRIDRMRPIPLSPSMLLGDGRREQKSELTAPTRARVSQAISSLLPSTLCMIFTVSVMLSAKEGLTVVSVIESLLKLSTLPIVGLRGYSDGYNLVMGADISWLRTRRGLLEAFLKRTEG